VKTTSQIFRQIDRLERLAPLSPAAVRAQITVLADLLTADEATVRFSGAVRIAAHRAAAWLRGSDAPEPSDAWQAVVGITLS
jgi:hypothetical protein